MGLESLTEIELIQVTFALLFVIVSLIVGIRILLKYFTVRNKVFVTVGLTWVFLSSPWWGNAISFFTFAFNEQEISLFLDLFLGNIFIPLAVVLWVYSFCKLVYPHLTKTLVSVYGIISSIYEILLLYYFFTDLNVIGKATSRFNTEHNLFPFMFQILAIATALITGIILSKNSMDSEDARIQWKGRFLLLGFISFTFAAVFDAAIPMGSLLLAIIRAVLISSAIEYYLGFLLPDKIAHWLIKS